MEFIKELLIPGYSEAKKRKETNLANANEARQSPAFARLKEKFTSASNTPSLKGLSPHALTFGDLVDILTVYHTTYGEDPSYYNLGELVYHLKSTRIFVEEDQQQELHKLKNKYPTEQDRAANPLFATVINMDNVLEDADSHGRLELTHYPGGIDIFPKSKLKDQPQSYYVAIGDNSRAATSLGVYDHLAAVLSETGLPIDSGIHEAHDAVSKK